MGSTDLKDPDFSGVPINKIPVAIRSRITTEPVHERKFSKVIQAPGGVAVDLSKMAKVSSRIEGQVEKLFVHLGESVKKGDPLLAIGSLKLDELVEEFLVSDAQVDLRKANFLRTKKLHAEQIVSERRLLEDQAQFLEAQAVNQHMTEKLQNMGLSQQELNDLLERHTIEGHHYIIKAPLTGTISEQSVVLGQGIRSGDHLFQIVDTRKVWVFANLPVEQAQRFHLGDQGTIVPKGREPIHAPLTYIAPVADKATLTVQLRFDVPNPEGVLKPNEYVDVHLQEGVIPTLAIPVAAFTLVEGIRGVFVKRREIFRFVEVQVGKESGGWTEVVAGLKVGDEVVIEGVFDLKNSLMKSSIEGEG